jgi:RimJ/RimL family protein N-acetyltransferase
MIATDLFTGQLVRLAAAEPEQMGKTVSRWGRNSQYLRLLDTDAARVWSSKQAQTWFEKPSPKDYEFEIYALPEDKLIGFVGLFIPLAAHRCAWVGIGIGEPEYWGKGYGTEAMRLALRYGFMEINLHRVALGVFSYNKRAIRSYEKAGFAHEGRMRNAIKRDGEFDDVVYMGILRSEWMERYGK